MAEPARKKKPSSAMARILRNKQGATGPVDLEARLHDLRPLEPSAEYVALANQEMGREGAGPAFMEGVRQEEREQGGMYGTLPLAPGASARLPVHMGPMPEGPPVSAEVVARAKAAGVMPPDEARARGWKDGQWQAFRGAQAGGSPNPRLLAALLRAGR